MMCVLSVQCGSVYVLCTEYRVGIQRYLLECREREIYNDVLVDENCEFSRNVHY